MVGPDLKVCGAGPPGPAGRCGARPVGGARERRAHGAAVSARGARLWASARATSGAWTLRPLRRPPGPELGSPTRPRRPRPRPAAPKGEAERRGAESAAAAAPVWAPLVVLGLCQARAPPGFPLRRRLGPGPSRIPSLAKCQPFPACAGQTSVPTSCSSFSFMSCSSLWKSSLPSLQKRSADVGNSGFLKGIGVDYWGLSLRGE